MGLMGTALAARHEVTRRLSKVYSMSRPLTNVESIGSYLESLTAPRQTRNRKHLLRDILVIVVCGCNGPTAIHRWATQRLTWLQQFLQLSSGIPSRDCLRRLLMMLKPEAYQKCFQVWLDDGDSHNVQSGRRLVAIDGKTYRGSHSKSQGLKAWHLVSAWASEAGIALGQVAADEKSNEITAIPELLEQLDLSQALVTIDAMGCPKEIAKQIVASQGEFVIAVKDNQPKLCNAITEHFQKHLENDLEDLRSRHFEAQESSHGRIDDRS